MGLNEKMNRLEALKSRISLGGILIGSGCIVFAIGMLSNTVSEKVGSGGFMILVFLMIGIGVYLINGSTKRYKSLYKELFVEEPLRQNFDNVFYSPNAGFSEDEVRGFNLIPSWNKFKTEDYLKATYRNIDFQMADFVIERTSGKSTVLIFKGRIIVFDFPSKFIMSTYIFTKDELYSNKPRRGIGEKIEMESIEFNRTFNVYSDMPHDSFYLLTPHFMEKLMKMKKLYPGFAISFQGNRVIVALNERSNNAFDNNYIQKDLSYPEEIQKIQGDIDDIKKIIEIVDSLEDE